MFIFEMIYMSVSANLGLIAIALITLATFAIAIWGEKWMQVAIDKNPEFWLEERDMSIKAIWNRRKNK